MRLHYLQHVPFEGLGSIAQWATKAGAEISCTKLFDNEALPPVDQLDWLVIMGGPMNIYEDDSYPWLAHEKQFIKQAINNNKIVLGVCLGAQLIADVLGAKVFANAHKEIGWLPITVSKDLPQELRETFSANSIPLHWHGDTFDLPANSIRLAESAACINQGFIYRQRVIGLQFHLETTRKSLEDLIEHCSDELIDAPYIQNAIDMLAEENRFTEANAMMNRLLNFLAAIQ